MQLVAADWLRSDKREDDLSSRYGGIVQVRFGQDNRSNKKRSDHISIKHEAKCSSSRKLCITFLMNDL